MKLVDGKYKRISWEQALNEVGDKLLAIRKESGPDATYWIGSSKHSNEQAYLMRKFVSFFGTNEVVLTALSATFTGMFGLHESTQALESMKKGIDQSLETLSEIGSKVQEAALKAGYGPTISAAAVKKLVDSVVTYQERSIGIIAEMNSCSDWCGKVDERQAWSSPATRSRKLVRLGFLFGHLVLKRDAELIHVSPRLWPSRSPSAYVDAHPPLAISPDRRPT